MDHSLTLLARARKAQKDEDYNEAIRYAQLAFEIIDAPENRRLGALMVMAQCFRRKHDFHRMLEVAVQGTSLSHFGDYYRIEFENLAAMGEFQLEQERQAIARLRSVLAQDISEIDQQRTQQILSRMEAAFAEFDDTSNA